MKVPKEDYKQYPNHLNDIAWCGEELMNERIDCLMDYMRKDDRILRHYGYGAKDLPDNVILYGVDMMVTVSNLISFTLYNTSFFAIPCIEKGVCGVDVIADPSTLDYKIKIDSYYGGFGYPQKANPIIKTRDDLDDVSRIYFDGIVAKTLWNHKYGEFPNLYPIMEKDLQVKLFGKIMDDDFIENDEN